MTLSGALGYVGGRSQAKSVSLPRAREFIEQSDSLSRYKAYMSSMGDGDIDTEDQLEAFMKTVSEALDKIDLIERGVQDVRFVLGANEQELKEQLRHVNAAASMIINWMNQMQHFVDSLNGGKYDSYNEYAANFFEATGGYQKVAQGIAYVRELGVRLNYVADRLRVIKGQIASHEEEMLVLKEKIRGSAGVEQVAALETEAHDAYGRLREIIELL